MGWFDFMLLVLAAFRMTHLIVYDDIAEPLRRRFAPDSFAGRMLACYWCCGIWVSFGTVAAYHWWGDAILPLLLAFAVAGGQAVLATALRRRGA